MSMCASLTPDGYTVEDLIFRFSDDRPIQYREGAMHSTNFLVDGFLTDKCDSRTSTGKEGITEKCDPRTGTGKPSLKSVIRGPAQVRHH